MNAEDSDVSLALESSEDESRGGPSPRAQAVSNGEGHTASGAQGLPDTPRSAPQQQQSQSMHPDYEVPAGSMTEADVYQHFQQHGIRTDRYGFVDQQQLQHTPPQLVSPRPSLQQHHPLPAPQPQHFRSQPSTPRPSSSVSLPLQLSSRFPSNSANSAAPANQHSSPCCSTAPSASTATNQSSTPFRNPGGSGSGQMSMSARDARAHPRRLRKWLQMLGPQGEHLGQYMAAHPAKFKERVRKGIPEELRGLSWQLLSGGRLLQCANPGVYQALQEHVEVETDTAIMRDLNRTFPHHVFFMYRQGPGQRALYNVLRAYAAYDRKVGYVQGMGFIAAVLLLHMGEEESFWTLVALMKGPPLQQQEQLEQRVERFGSDAPITPAAKGPHSLPRHQRTGSGSAPSTPAAGSTWSAGPPHPSSLSSCCPQHPPPTNPNPPTHPNCQQPPRHPRRTPPPHMSIHSNGITTAPSTPNGSVSGGTHKPFHTPTGTTLPARLNSPSNSVHNGCCHANGHHSPLQPPGHTHSPHRGDRAQQQQQQPHKSPRQHHETNGLAERCTQQCAPAAHPLPTANGHAPTQPRAHHAPHHVHVTHSTAHTHTAASPQTPSPPPSARSLSRGTGMVPRQSSLPSTSAARAAAAAAASSHALKHHSTHATHGAHAPEKSPATSPAAACVVPTPTEAAANSACAGGSPLKHAASVPAPHEARLLRHSRSHASPQTHARAHRDQQLQLQHQPHAQQQQQQQQQQQGLERKRSCTSEVLVGQELARCACCGTLLSVPKASSATTTPTPTPVSTATPRTGCCPGSGDEAACSGESFPGDATALAHSLAGIANGSGRSSDGGVSPRGDGAAAAPVAAPVTAHANGVVSGNGSGSGAAGGLCGAEAAANGSGGGASGMNGVGGLSEGHLCRSTDSSAAKEAGTLSGNGAGFPAVLLHSALSGGGSSHGLTTTRTTHTSGDLDPLYMSGSQLGSDSFPSLSLPPPPFFQHPSGTTSTTCTPVKQHPRHARSSSLPSEPTSRAHAYTHSLSELDGSPAGASAQPQPRSTRSVHSARVGHEAGSPQLGSSPAKPVHPHAHAQRQQSTGACEGGVCGVGSTHVPTPVEVPSVPEQATEAVGGPPPSPFKTASARGNGTCAPPSTHPPSPSHSRDNGSAQPPSPHTHTHNNGSAQPQPPHPQLPLTAHTQPSALSIPSSSGTSEIQPATPLKFNGSSAHPPTPRAQLRTQPDTHTGPNTHSTQDSQAPNAPPQTHSTATPFRVSMPDSPPAGSHIHPPTPFLGCMQSQLCDSTAALACNSSSNGSGGAKTHASVGFTRSSNARSIVQSASSDAPAPLWVAPAPAATEASRRSSSVMQSASSDAPTPLSMPPADAPTAPAHTPPVAHTAAAPAHTPPLAHTPAAPAAQTAHTPALAHTPAAPASPTAHTAAAPAAPTAHTPALAHTPAAPASPTEHTAAAPAAPTAHTPALAHTPAAPASPTEHTAAAPTAHTPALAHTPAATAPAAAPAPAPAAPNTARTQQVGYAGPSPLNVYAPGVRGEQQQRVPSRLSGYRSTPSLQPEPLAPSPSQPLQPSASAHNPAPPAAPAAAPAPAAPADDGTSGSSSLKGTSPGVARKGKGVEVPHLWVPSPCVPSYLCERCAAAGMQDVQDTPTEAADQLEDDASDTLTSTTTSSDASSQQPRTYHLRVGDRDGSARIAGPMMQQGQRFPLGSMYVAGMPLLQQSLYQLQGLIKDEVPRLAKLFEREGLEVAMFSTCWFNTIFAYCLPFSHLLRIWDIFMLEGLKIVFRSGIVLLKNAEKRLTRVGSIENMVECLGAKNIPSLLPPPSTMIKMALKIKVSKRLAELQQQWQQKQRAQGQEFALQ